MSDTPKTLSDVKLDNRNANKGTAKGAKMLVNSVQQNGWGRSGLLDKNNRAIAGNKSTQAAVEVFGVDVEPIIVDSDGTRPVYVRRTDLDLDDPNPNSPARRLAHLDNLTTYFDYSPDLPTFAADIEAGFDFAAIDVTLPDLGKLLERDVAELLGGEAGKETEAKISKAEELQAVWQVQPGQMFACGEHRIICGDCTDRAVVEKVMGGEKAALVVTDPPYGVSYADKNKFLNAISPANRVETPIENDHLDKEATQQLWKLSFIEMLKVMDSGAVLYCFMPQGGDQMMMMMMMMNAGIEPRHEIIWLKNNHVLGRVDYAYKHEPILYAWKDGGHKFYGDFQTSILEYPKPQSSEFHPTTKPVALVEKLISNSSKKGEIVFDQFIGSGTTMIASDNLNRRCRGVEISPAYCSVVLQRFLDHSGIQPVLL